MPVTLKIEDKEKRQAAGAAQVPDLSDYALPNERSEGAKAFWIWLALIIPVGIAFTALEATRGIGIGILIWWLACVFIYFVIAPRLVVRRLRLHGAEYEITSKKSPRLKTLLVKGSKLLGIAEPEAFLVAEGISQVRILGRKDPYFLVVTQAAVDLLQPAELDCLILRALIHGRQRNVARLMLLQFLNDTPPATRLLVWPAVLYGTLLRSFWLDTAEQSADRLTLLLMKNSNILLSALLKQQASTDPIMQEARITSADVDNFIRQGGEIGIAGDEISTQYKIGSAIHENPYLEERVQGIGRWAKSPEYREALKKLAESKSDSLGTTTPGKSTSAVAFDPLAEQKPPSTRQ